MIKHERRLILRYPGDKNTLLKISLRCVFMGFRVNTWWREYHYCSFCWRFRMSILILCITDIIVVVIFWEGTVRRTRFGWPNNFIRYSFVYTTVSTFSFYKILSKQVIDIYIYRHDQPKGGSTLCSNFVI
jgi:hypothetical protein